MRPLIELVLTDSNGVRFMVAHLYDNRGQLAEQLILPAIDNRIVKYAVTELLATHKVDTVDMQTDSDEVFKTFLPVIGVNVSFTMTSDLGSLYRLFRKDSAEYQSISDLWFPELVTAKPETSDPQTVPLWKRIFNTITNLIKRRQ
jgi:hypothetical protein